MVKLGQRVRDSISGFEGVVTGRAEYISGCHQALVAPTVTAEGAFRNSEWFDEQRLQVLNAPAVVLDNGKTPGADRQAPRR
jgi:hypothetical protein